MREESPFSIDMIPLMSRSLRNKKNYKSCYWDGTIQKVLSFFFNHLRMSFPTVRSSLHFRGGVGSKRKWGTRQQHKGPDGKVGGCFIHQAGSVKLTAFAGNNILSCSWAVASLGPH